MKSGSLLVLAGAGIAAWLLISRKNQGEGGTGGSLDIPALFGTGNIGGDPNTVSVPVSQQSSQPAFQISPKIQAAMSLFQVPGGFSVPSTANPNPQYGTQYGYGSTGYFSPGTAPGTFFGSDPTGQKQAQANDFYARTAAYEKKASSSSRSIPAALAGAANPITVSQQGGATVYTQASKKSNNFGLGRGRTTRY